MKNPFKFGTVVDDPFFINRKNEIKKVTSFLSGENHLVLISPRRMGKSSLIHKAVSSLGRPVIALDMQLMTSTADLAAQMLRRIYRIFPQTRLKQHLNRFRIIPQLSLNPVTGSVDVSFMQGVSSLPILEDVLNLAEKLSTEKKKLIIVFDEFQEARRLDENLLNQLRAIMQHHKMINYVFLGSQESLIREVFQKQKSPFYHFAAVMYLRKIAIGEFSKYLEIGFNGIHDDPGMIAGEILEVTRGHPYYTQQLAFTVWEIAVSERGESDIHVDDAVRELIRMHDMDYERIWMSFNSTDRKVLLGLSISEQQPLTAEFMRIWDLNASSTVFSSLKRLMTGGYVIKTDRYELDDPFFSRWIKERRER
ncbi:MAG: ATP-binding protein [Bacteroidales bacterium]|jgi:AAA+ ATPase superfamily predicted ATPase|nr:ATP-binding protein [Bacteroidales bacterium]